MPKQVTIAASNRYCQARLNAAKYNDDFATRVKAVEHLPGVTEDSLKKYELDINRPPNTVVAMMADAYNEPELRQWYCANECPLGKDCRDIEAMPAERTLIRLQNVKTVMSIVERASRPTIAATSIPPLRINLSRYSEREMRSRNRSIM